MFSSTFQMNRILAVYSGNSMLWIYWPPEIYPEGYLTNLFWSGPTHHLVVGAAIQTRRNFEASSRITNCLLPIPFSKYTISSSLESPLILLCLLISASCYSKIFLMLRHHQIQAQEHVHQGQPDGKAIPLNI